VPAILKMEAAVSPDTLVLTYWTTYRMSLFKDLSPGPVHLCKNLQFEAYFSLDATKSVQQILHCSHSVINYELVV
jgi:hypothetical protein